MIIVKLFALLIIKPHCNNAFRTEVSLFVIYLYMYLYLAIHYFTHKHTSNHCYSAWQTTPSNGDIICYASPVYGS